MPAEACVLRVQDMKEQKRNITTSIKLHAQKDKQQMPCRRSAKLLVHTAATHILIKCNAKSLKNCELCIAYTLTIKGSYDRIYMIYTESIAGHLASTIYTYLYCKHLRCRSTVGGSPTCAHYKCTPNIFVILVDLIGCYIVVCMTGPVYVQPLSLVATTSFTCILLTILNADTEMLYVRRKMATQTNE